MEKFVFLTDVHFGYERRGGHKVALHDVKALNATLSFLKDFKPDHIILGGDILDCGSISHHNKGKPGAVEGFRLIADAKELRGLLIEPLEALNADTYTYIIGNHEDWLTQLTDTMPALEGVVDINALLDLSGWDVIPQGGAHKLGKLVFVHGDQLSGGEHVAKSATVAYEKSIRFGHFHTYQVYSKTSAVEEHGHTGVAVPCLCKKGPAYGKGAPNRWQQGFLWGYVGKGGTFNDYVSVIVGGQTTINGKTYVG